MLFWIFIWLFLVIGVNECNISLCKNGGKCFDFYYGFRCKCVSGYEGDICEFGK